MKTNTPVILLLMIAAALFFSSAELWGQQNTEPWEKEQLAAPADLAETLNDSSKQNPLILAVNPDGMYGLPYKGGIKGSKWFGAAEKEEHLNKLKDFLKDVDKDEDIVIYCGCCPFDMCPNIRPAFNLLNEQGFTHHRLLNMPKDIKENWIDKGYPMKNKTSAH